MTYEVKTFDIPELDGISRDTIDNHLGLYEGYVKNTNKIISSLTEEEGTDDNKYARAEMQRRLGFEFGGMRNHEYYFAQFEGGANELPDGTLQEKLEAEWGNFGVWEKQFRAIAATRGVGWAMLYHDPQTNRLVQTWVDEQHLGQLADLDIILALDMWEHSYMRDYVSSDKGKYVDAFFKNLNWEVVAGRLN